jgi:hypothetical protein
MISESIYPGKYTAKKGVRRTDIDNGSFFKQNEIHILYE